MSAFRTRREMTAAIRELPPPHPATDPTEQAIRTVARRVLANAVAGAIELGSGAVSWEDHPEIGQYDWDKVLADVRHLAGFSAVQNEHYDAAYQHLADRAAETEEGPR